MYVDLLYQTRKREKVFHFLFFFRYIILCVMVSYQFLMKKIAENVLVYRNLCIFAPQNRKVMLNWAMV